MRPSRLIALFVCLAVSVPLSAQAPAQSSPEEAMRAEIDQMKKQLAALEQKLADQEKANQRAAEQAKAEQAKAEAAAAPQPESQQLVSKVKDLEHRVQKTERNAALDRVRITGDFRFEAHTINSTIPNHYDGMALQNLLVQAIFAMQQTGAPPTSVAQITNTVANNYGSYLYFTNNLTFNQLKADVNSVPPAMQQGLFSMITPSTYVKGYKDDTNILYTNRLRLNLDADVSDNIKFVARLSMYKVFGDSTGVQVFNGQPNSISLDGTTAGVPSSDILRVERAYFTWNNIRGSKFFLSVGRRPSTEGPPMNLRQDEQRGGTPSGALIDYQFDGITFGYHLRDTTTLRLCYGLGYSSEFGSGAVMQLPQDRLKDVHFLGANIDAWTTEKSLVQITVARAFNVTDGFNGEVVLPVNPLTGDPVNAPVVMRYTPSANLGDIDLYGITAMHRTGSWDLFASADFDTLRPNGQTTPFGGLGSDPFQVPTVHWGGMFYAGARYNLANDKTKIGFEFNDGSKYWFNFAQAQDDIIAPKTATRGQNYEAYITHRLTERFIAKLDLIRYNYKWSGSGWQLGDPKLLSQTPTLGFPTYKDATMLTLSLIARF